MSSGKVCPVCENDGILECGGCGEVHYCTRQHQREDWINHKPDCRSFRVTSHPEAGE